MNLAIIPARGGSKRILGKNIRDFCSKPIIAYSIDAAIKSGLFEEVMVSTDSEEIANIARKYDAKIPFLRSQKNADDYATLADVVIEVIDHYQKQGKNFESICCILPTAPLIARQRIIEAYNKMLNEHFDSVCPVTEFSYPIFRALKIVDNNKLKMIWPEHLTSRSQDLQQAYHDSGSFYWVKAEVITKERTLFCENGGAIILSETEVQDIDTETDWKLAEIKFKLLND